MCSTDTAETTTTDISAINIAACCCVLFHMHTNFVLKMVKKHKLEGNECKIHKDSQSINHCKHNPKVHKVQIVQQTILSFSWGSIPYPYIVDHCTRYEE